MPSLTKISSNLFKYSVDIDLCHISVFILIDISIVTEYGTPEAITWLQQSAHGCFETQQTNQLHGTEAYLRSWPSEGSPLVLLNSKVHYRFHSNLPLVPIFKQTNPVHASPHPILLRSVLILSSHLSLVFQVVSSRQVFQPKFCMHYSKAYKE